MVPATITVMVPAYNEAVDIANTIEGLLKQSRIPDQILVIDDCSTDGTGDIARKYPVEVRQPPSNCGSKAIAQNWGMQFVTGDLVLPVDGDTILSPDYIEKIIPYFEEDDNLSVAAGCVLTQKTSSVWEQGRMMEYLFGFHWYRIIQNWYDSPTVCSGCCTVFRTKWVEEFGGFPQRTMVEDIDFTWSQQIMGRKALYIPDIVAYAAEPSSREFLCKQLNRWKSGWFQNVRLHWKDLLKSKKMLALWVSLSMYEIMMSPVLLLVPLLLVLSGLPLWMVILVFLAGELVFFYPPILYGCIKRGIPWWKPFLWYPSFFLLKVHNFFYDVKCSVTELVLVPMGLAKGLTTYVRGKA